MTTSQSVVTGVLWIATLGLLALVLLNYRLIDRLYSGANRIRTGGLKPGIEIPPINVVTDFEGSGAALMLPSDGQRYLLAFVSIDCDGCRTLLTTLAARKAFSGFVTAVVVEGVPRGRPVADLPADIPVYVAHSGAHVKREFGITVVPLVYVMRDQTVLATGTVASEAELHELLSLADTNQEGLRAVNAPVGTHRSRSRGAASLANDAGPNNG